MTRAAILMFDGVQIIDFSAPFEVLGQADWRPFLIAADDGLVQTCMDMRVPPSHTFHDAPDFDVLVIPGGDIEPARADVRIRNFVAHCWARCLRVLSVCNGLFFLADQGVLAQQEVATFYECFDELRVLAPEARIRMDQRVTRNAKLITTAGMTAGIDGALALVDDLDGRVAAQQVALHMEVDWRPDKAWTRGDLADAPLRAVLGRNLGVAGTRLIETSGDTRHWRCVYVCDGEVDAATLFRRAGWRADGEALVSDAWRLRLKRYGGRLHLDLSRVDV